MSDRLDPFVDEVMRRPSPWRWSKKGYLWRRYGNLTLTVFLRDDDRYGWCIAAPDGPPRYSRRSYATEDDALDALMKEVNR